MLYVFFDLRCESVTYTYMYISLYVIFSIFLCCIFNLQVSCIGILISASITLPAINQVEDFYVKHRFEHGEHGFDAEWHRWAAGWLVFVGSAVISLNILMIIFRVLYLKSILKYYFVLYALIVSNFCYVHTYVYAHVSQHEKTGLVYTKYMYIYSYYGMYLLYCSQF